MVLGGFAIYLQFSSRYTAVYGALAGTVIGIIGPGFDFREFGPAPDVWTPFQLDPSSRDQGHYFMAGGRLKPGVSMQTAAADFDVGQNADHRRG